MDHACQRCGERVHPAHARHFKGARLCTECWRRVVYADRRPRNVGLEAALIAILLMIILGSVGLAYNVIFL